MEDSPICIRYSCVPEPNFCGEEGYVGISPFVVTPRKDSYAPVKKVEGFTEFSKIIGSSFFLAGCASPPAPRGGLNEPCYPNGTCNEGLECLEGICVDKEAADDDKPDGGMHPDGGNAVDGGWPDAGTPTHGADFVESIAAGTVHTCAFKGDKTAWCWGYNAKGSLGDGTAPREHFTPVRVANLTNVVSISSGFRHSCAAKEDGTAWCWGGNDVGQIGDGTSANRFTPVQVADLSGVLFVSAGYDHSCAVKQDGTAWCWGFNAVGKLGDGTTTDHRTPVQVTNLSDVVSIKTGGSHSCALKRDETVWCWGDNTRGQVGNGTDTLHYPAPVAVANLTGILSIDAVESYTCAVKRDGTTWCWGYNEYVDIGNNMPIPVNNLGGVLSVATGKTHTCVVKNDRSAWCWGSNDVGQIGDGTDTDRFTPVQVADLSEVLSISAGYYHNCAVKQDGTAWCWGDNTRGQIGDGSERDRFAPVQVQW